MWQDTILSKRPKMTCREKRCVLNQICVT